MFRLNWASCGIGEKRIDLGPEHSIFIRNLAPDVTDYLLQETFQAHYPSIRCAKVVTDPNTGRSKGYGFVKCFDEIKRNRTVYGYWKTTGKDRPVKYNEEVVGDDKNLGFSLR
ncbi:hypothetical protein REPUB_Repub07fG0084700 [Reevesia pubescens]